jgi:hypothetical protein
MWTPENRCAAGGSNKRAKMMIHMRTIVELYLHTVELSTVEQ